MSITRRKLLGWAAALPAAGLGTAGFTPLRAQDRTAAAVAESDDLRASVFSRQLAPEGYPATEVWGYNGAIPGPEIRQPQGSRLRRRLVNGLPEPSSIHWHGIRLENGMDGVPGLTQEPVAPGESFDYGFDLPDAGTYWYHTHNRSYEQMARGLFGPLIVTEAEPPEADTDLVLFLDDWRLGGDGTIAAGFGAAHDAAHAGRLGNFITVNGAFDFRRKVQQGERLRLRVINGATSRIFPLALDAMAGWIVAFDGMPLAGPESADGRAIVLGPAQRVDLIVDVTAEAGEQATLVGIERGQGFALASFDVASGKDLARGPRGAPLPLPANPLQLRHPALVAGKEMRRQEMLLQGGAMRALQSASYQGRRQDGQALADQGKYWAFSDVIGLPEAPFARLSPGETLRIDMVNDTAFAHAMHLHGTHFREIDAEGAPGPWRDTLLIDPDERRSIAFVADQPGNWLFHCHMLAHQEAGMKTWIEVTA